MVSSELSRLLYLTDALEAAPEQGAKLIEIVNDTDASDGYRKEIAKLQALSANPQALKKASAELKTRL